MARRCLSGCVRSFPVKAGMAGLGSFECSSALLGIVWLARLGLVGHVMAGCVLAQNGCVRQALNVDDLNQLEIIDAYRSGKSMNEIAFENECDLSTIARCLRRFHIPRRNDRVNVPAHTRTDGWSGQLIIIPAHEAKWTYKTVLRRGLYPAPKRGTTIKRSRQPRRNQRLII